MVVRKIVRMLIEPDKNLQSLNTFKVPCRAETFIRIDDIQELNSPIIQNNLRDFYVLGQGSNTLFVKDRINTILKFNTKGIKVDRRGSNIFITVEAGQTLHDVVNFCVNNNYGGMENLALIPGTVSAAPVQNVGAYGVEISDVLHSLQVFDVKAGKFESLTKDECRLSYRSSIFKELPGRYIIVRVVFRLCSKYTPNSSYKSLAHELAKENIHVPSVKQIYEAVCAVRTSKLPNPFGHTPNAGSFFKNPFVSKTALADLVSKFPSLSYSVDATNKVKLNAAQLIEMSNAAQLKTDRVCTWYKQPLVIVNQNSATGKEIYDFSEAIIKKVKACFGIVLDREVNVI